MKITTFLENFISSALTTTTSVSASEDEEDENQIMFEQELNDAEKYNSNKTAASKKKQIKSRSRQQQAQQQQQDKSISIRTQQEEFITTTAPEDNNSNRGASKQAWQLEKKYTLREIQSHCSLEDCWMVIFDKVYDITDFVYEHPGGDFILLEYAGRDATHPFLSSRHGSLAYKMLDKYWIGILVDEELYYSNNSSYCSVYSSLSWRSTPTTDSNEEEIESSNTAITTTTSNNNNSDNNNNKAHATFVPQTTAAR